MKKIKITIAIGLLIGLSSFSQIKKSNDEIDESKLLSYIVNPTKQELKFY